MGLKAETPFRIRIGINTMMHVINSSMHYVQILGDHCDEVWYCKVSSIYSIKSSGVICIVLSEKFLQFVVIEATWPAVFMTSQFAANEMPTVGRYRNLISLQMWLE